MHRLIYKSKCKGKMDRVTLRDILDTSVELNKKAGLTGALLATDTHFLQVLEGDFIELNTTFLRIARDLRHDTVELIYFGPAARKIFEGWYMRGFGIFDLNKELEAELKKKYGEEHGGVRFPVEEWAALALFHDVKMITENWPES